VRNTVRPKSACPGEATFTLTTPDAKQQQALVQIPAHCGQRSGRIADSNPMIADSY
jgi:hypothetical protein